MSDESMIAALLREREGYVRRGLAARVAHVDDELRKLGHKPPRAERVTPRVETATDSSPVETAAATRRRQPR